ncbi:adenylate/guanylate cyclase domain-containing protein [Treponema bryantii]|uniref:adenylate/guanylate cyclase domain-containing protein n=1 Tax=Treponema bryantii TaxID=163 RepID=UPI002B2D71FD|nr:hypothetical protein TRBR_06080 [Treponema bryantii]
MSKVLVAVPSKILSKVICMELKKLGYETEVFSDGYSAFKQIVHESPDLIIADKELPEINGIELCHILKTGSPKSALPFVLVSVDDSVFDFWNTAREANRVVLVKNDNIEVLVDTVKELLGNGYVEVQDFFTKDDAEQKETETSDKSEEETLASWVVTAMANSDFFFNMTQNVIQLYSAVKEIDFLVEQIFRMLYSACAFDAAALILDSHPAKVYITGTEFFDVSIGDEFWNICKVEYEQQAKKNHTITYEEKYFENILLTHPSREKFESYRSFTLKSEKDFIGTLHIASTQKKLFNYKIQSSIDFITPALSNILQEAIRCFELTQQESKLRAAFSKFVPAEVISDFLSSGENQELANQNEKRNVVVLLCDIRSFTSISEINKPENVVNFLNTYFTYMVNIVKKYGGTVDKFIGDAIMVLFGAPISYNDNARRAVQAAIEMYSQLDAIPVNQLKFPEGVKLDIGIGIHSGDVIVGQIGSADKTNYTVIGDTVNLASRLEGLTKLYGAKIVISQAVRDELGDSMNVLLLDSVKVKGKKEAVFVYRVDEKPLPEDFTDAYEKGFKSYNEGAFTLAIPYFEAAVNILPDNKAARLMLERCEEFSVNKPDNWDGAIALTSK